MIEIYLNADVQSRNKLKMPE